MKNKPKIMISFQEGSENGGPFTSHKRIMESKLQNDYNFMPLVVPKGRIGLFNLKNIQSLLSQIEAFNPDIIHIHGLQLVGFQLLLASKIKRKKVVIAVHGSSNEALSISYLKRNLINILEIITLKNSDIIYGVSDYVCNWKIMTKYSKKLFGTIYNIPHKYQAEINTNKLNMLKKEFDFKDNDVIVVSTGRITREKGFDVLCDIIISLKHQNNIKFLIAGDGVYLHEFLERINKEQLSGRVKLLGFRDDIANILKISDIFVICTLHETLCNSILEACNESLPIIATNVGGIPEIIENNINGFLVDKNDVQDFVRKIEELALNETMRLSLGKKSKKIIEEKFSEEDMIKSLNEIYRSLLDEKL